MYIFIFSWFFMMISSATQLNIDYVSYLQDLANDDALLPDVKRLHIGIHSSDLSLRGWGSRGYPQMKPQQKRDMKEKIRSSINKVIQKCEHIEELSIRSDVLSDSDLPCFCNLALKKLSVGVLEIADDFFEKNFTCELLSSIKSLDLSGCIRISDRCLALLKDLPLTSLDISRCYSISHLDDFVKNLRVTRLSFSYMGPEGAIYRGHDPESSSIVDQDLEQIKDLALEKLEICGAQITRQGLVHIQNIPLRHLSLSNCLGIKNEDFQLMQNMPLEKLELEGCNQLTEECLAYLKDLPLTHLNTPYSSWLSNSGLAFLEKMPLTEITLSGRNITDEGIARLNTSTLQKVTFLGCDNITAAGVLAFRDTALKKIVFRECRQIRDEELSTLAQSGIEVINTPTFVTRVIF